MKKWIVIIVCSFLAAGAVIFHFSNDNEIQLVWNQEPLGESVKVLPGVLDAENIPMDIEEYEKTIPLDTDKEDIIDVSTGVINKEDKIRVGFSQMEVNNEWRIYENVSVIYAADELDIELEYKDAESSHERQLEDIREFIAEGVDFIIIAPRQEFGYSEVFNEAKEAGIPVILLDRRVDGIAGEDYVTCIMGDFISVGRSAGELLYEKFGDRKITVLEVTGTMISSVAKDIDKGFRQIAHEHGWTIYSVDGDFEQNSTLNVLEEAFIKYGDSIDAVFTHIDDSAMSAISVMKYAGYTPGIDIDNSEIPIVSMGGYKDALDAISAHKMLATIECNPRLGYAALKVVKILSEGGTVKSRITIPAKIYTVDNIEQYIDVEGY